MKKMETEETKEVILTEKEESEGSLVSVEKKKPNFLIFQDFVYFLYFLLAFGQFFCYYINVVSRNDYLIVRRCQNGKM